jgi:hypothetical protein
VHPESHLLRIFLHAREPGVGGEHIHAVASMSEVLDDGLARQGVAADAVRGVLVGEDEDAHSGRG